MLRPVLTERVLSFTAQVYSFDVDSHTEVIMAA